MDIGTLLQSFSGQSMTASGTGLSDQRIAGAEDGETFLQTIRRFLGQDGGNSNTLGGDATSGPQEGEDPTMEKDGQDLLEYLAACVEAIADKTDSAVPLGKIPSDLEALLAGAIENGGLSTIDADQMQTLIGSDVNPPAGENGLPGAMEATDLSRSTATILSAAGVAADGKAVVPQLDSATADNLSAMHQPTDARMTATLQEGLETKDVQTAPADKSIPSDSANNFKMAEPVTGSEAAADWKRKTDGTRTSTDKSDDAKMEAIKAMQGKAAGIAGNDPPADGRGVQSKEMSDQRQTPPATAMRKDGDASATVQWNEVGKELPEKEPAGRQIPSEVVRSSSVENLKPDTLTDESPKATLSTETIAAGKAPVTADGILDAKSSAPSTAGTAAQGSGDAAFHKAVMDQIVEKAVFRSSNDRSEMRIQLKPETLGDVRMSIVAEKNHLAVRMIADSAEVKHIIESQLHHLKAELDRQGLTVEKIDVMVSGDGDSTQNREQFSQMFKNNSFGSGRRESGGRHQEPQTQSDSSHEREPDPSGDGISTFA
jgi:flagellar hook-length control protein FliK